MSVTGSLVHDGSDCDEAVWQDAQTEALRAIRRMHGGEIPTGALLVLPDPREEIPGTFCPECHGLWAHAPDCPLRPVRDPSDPRVP